MKLAVIMAGGEGKRLRPFTNSIPKPLLPIGRKPIAQIIIERLRDAGFTRVIMSLEYGADLIRAYFRDGSPFGIEIAYYQEPHKLGTAGCLANIPELAAATFLVTNGDILTDLDYAAFLAGHMASDAALTVATRREVISVPYGVLELNNGHVSGVTEKPSYDLWINAGIYALSPPAVGLIPAGRKFDMTDLVAAVAKGGGAVRAHEITGLWHDLATVEDFEKASEEITRRLPQINQP